MNDFSLQVRSRSLTQLDSLSGSMLDTGEHHLEGDPSQQQPPDLHHHQQSHQLQHHPLGIEYNRIRFLAPIATPAEIANSNRRHKLSRSQVSSYQQIFDELLFSVSRRKWLTTLFRHAYFLVEYPRALLLNSLAFFPQFKLRWMSLRLL